MSEFILTCCGLVLIGCIIMLIKNENTYKNHRIIGHAIFLYSIACIREDVTPLVDYSDIEDYDCTMWRLWDWGYTRLLPKDKYAIIASYIK